MRNGSPDLRAWIEARGGQRRRQAQRGCEVSTPRDYETSPLTGAEVTQIVEDTLSRLSISIDLEYDGSFAGPKLVVKLQYRHTDAYTDPRVISEDRITLSSLQKD
jgi:hypothetical protein